MPYTLSVESDEYVLRDDESHQIVEMFEIQASTKKLVSDRLRVSASISTILLATYFIIKKIVGEPVDTTGEVWWLNAVIAVVIGLVLTTVSALISRSVLSAAISRGTIGFAIDEERSQQFRQIVHGTVGLVMGHITYTKTGTTRSTGGAKYHAGTENSVQISGSVNKPELEIDTTLSLFTFEPTPVLRLGPPTKSINTVPCLIPFVLLGIIVGIIFAFSGWWVISMVAIAYVSSVLRPTFPDVSVGGKSTTLLTPLGELHQTGDGKLVGKTDSLTGFMQLGLSSEGITIGRVLPGDAALVGTTRQYVNKDGSPDARFSHNPDVYQILVWHVTGQVFGNEIDFHSSNSHAAKELLMATGNRETWDRVVPQIKNISKFGD